MSKPGKIAVWVGRVALAFVFLVAGGHKLSGDPMMVDMFGKIGMGQGFRYFTGLTEVLTALLLLWPRTSFYGAILAACVMVGAFFAQLLVLHGDVIHTLVIGAVIAAMIWAQRPALSTAVGASK